MTLPLTSSYTYTYEYAQLFHDAHANATSGRTAVIGARKTAIQSHDLEPSAGKWQALTGYSAPNKGFDPFVVDDDDC